MSVNITIVTHNRLDLTKICLQSLLEKTKGNYTVTVVDNASVDGTGEYLLSLSATNPNVHLARFTSNKGVSVAANFGWGDEEYYVKLDNDIEILDGNWLERLISLAKNNERLGMIGYKLMNWNSREEFITLSKGERFISSNLCNGGCVLIPRHVHKKLGYWIEDHGKYGYEDKNYSDRAIASGYLVGYAPADPLPVRHLGHEKGLVVACREIAKKKNIQDSRQGEQLYVLNKFLFDSGIRNLYVDRRYLPEVIAGNIRFRTNPNYRAIIKLQQEYVSKLRYTDCGETISVDLSDVAQKDG